MTRTLKFLTLLLSSVFTFHLPAHAESFIPYTNDPFWSFDKGGYAVDTSGRSRFAPVDWDGDGDVDLIAGEGTGALHYFENTNGNFKEELDFFDFELSSNSTPSFADTDGDGSPDLMVIGTDRELYSYSISEGVLTEIDRFTPSYTQPSPSLIDWDEDGNMDMLVGFRMTGDIYRYELDTDRREWDFVEILLNSGGAYSSSSRILNVPFARDLDEDGDIDILLGKSDGTIEFQKNLKNETESSTDSFSIDTTIFSDTLDVGTLSAPSVADLTRDGILDLIVGNEEGSLLIYAGEMGDSGLVFSSTNLVTNSFVDVGIRAIVYGVSNPDGSTTIYIGEKDGVVSELTYYFSDQSFSLSENFLGIDFGDNSAISQGDIDPSSEGEEFIIGNKDGTLEIITQEGVRSTIDVTLAETHIAPIAYDVDEDEDLDLLIGTDHEGLILGINDSDSGTWSFEVFFTKNEIGTGYARLRLTPTIGDLDRDGDDDILLGNLEGHLTLLRNQGGDFTDRTNFIVEPDYGSFDFFSFSSPSLVDVNEDGDLDLVVGNSYGRIFFYLNDLDEDGEVIEDCNNADAGIFPGASELANGIDDNCDGNIDEGTQAFDDDGDGFSENAGDCDDTDSSLSPGVSEICGDEVDNNCNLEIDEDCSLSTTGESGTSADPVITPEETTGGTTGLGEETGANETTSGGTTGSEEVNPDEGETDSPGYSLVRGSGCSLNVDFH